MSEQKELKLYVFQDKADRNMMEGLLKMFYHAAYINKLGIADINGELFIVGVDEAQTDSEGRTVANYYPLAHILGDQKATELAALDV